MIVQAMPYPASSGGGGQFSVPDTMGQSSGSTLAATLPDDIEAGDIIIVPVQAQSSSSGLTSTAETGWEKTLSRNNGGFTDFEGAIFTKVADGSEGGTTPTVATYNRSVSKGYTAFRVRGLQTSWYGATAASHAYSSSDVSCPSVTTTADGRTVLHVIVGFDTDPVEYTAGAGWDLIFELDEVGAGSTGSEYFLAATSAVVATAGASGTETGTCGAAVQSVRMSLELVA